MTALRMYELFLDGIRKTSTGTVTPTVFNRLINTWGQLEWLERNLSMLEGGAEYTQKQIEDLQVLYIMTDGLFVHNAATMQPIPQSSTNVFIVPDNTTIGTVVYPRMYRQLNVRFKINYKNNPCFTGLSDWLPASIMRSDQELSILSNPFRKPTDERLYYKIRNNQFQLYTGTQSTGAFMWLEYYRYPVEIFYDQSAPVDCEFGERQSIEIVETSVRNYLERATDPRYQSFLNEEQIKSVSKF